MMGTTHQHSSGAPAGNSSSDTPSLTFFSGASDANVSALDAFQTTVNTSSTGDHPPGFVPADEAALHESEEDDAQRQIDDFIACQQVNPTADQWRFRVFIRDLLHEPKGSICTASRDSALHDEEDSLSDVSSDDSVNIDFGPQNKSVPSSWRSSVQPHSTSTPSAARSCSTLLLPPATAAHSTSLASPDCSAVVAPGNTSSESNAIEHIDSDVCVSLNNLLADVRRQKQYDRKSRTAADATSSPNSQPSPSPVTVSNAGPKILQFALPARPNDDACQVPRLTTPAAALKASRLEFPGPIAVTQVNDSAVKYERPRVFPMSAGINFSSANTIIKITNLPWGTTCDRLLKWLDNDVELHLIPEDVQVVSVHILCDRIKCRTKCPAYVELTSSKTAQMLISKKSMKELGGRKIKVALATTKELHSAIFPTWAQKKFSTGSGTRVVSNPELQGLVELCRLKVPFAKAIPERPYMNMLSLAAKYPWKSKDLLDPQTEEQAKVLQAVRESYKLLNQHGKRLLNYDHVKGLFQKFLESHGGVAGSLRPIRVARPVATAELPNPYNYPPMASQRSMPFTMNAFFVGKPSVQSASSEDRSTSPILSRELQSAHCEDVSTGSNKVKELLNKVMEQSGTAQIVESQAVRRTTSESVPTRVTMPSLKAGDGVSEASTCQQVSLLSKRASQDEHHTNVMFFATPKASSAQLLVEKPSGLLTIPESEKESIIEDPASRPRALHAAHRLEDTPNVIEKTDVIETLFTPTKAIQSKAKHVRQPTSDHIEKLTNSKKQEQAGTLDPVPKCTELEALAQDVGVSVDAIRAIVKKLGALI